ncbi:thioredoxin domain-containing protein 3 homolog isoform X2 [Cylas formicarius]|uniref:thioredoxin domain-containing protein 3 homolog isoform X2 n=1 Tax=Cylas formicarius TaxID=197179 RepID=UPI0029585081|nr:thioredoxin domain-containing protein 3 homolog isoform X2 [Cylas formicarius]
MEENVQRQNEQLNTSAVIPLDAANLTNMEDGGEARLTESDAGSGSSITPVDSGTATAEPVTTVHYISPASTASGRSEREGDFVDYYWPFYARDGAERRPVEGPDSSSSSSVASCAEHGLQRTLAIVKPEAFQFRDVVLRAVRESSLKIVNERVVRLTPEQVSEVYEKYYGTPAFPHLVVSASLSPVLVLSLQGIGAVDEWERVIGPRGPLRAEWFLPAAPDPRTARRENRYFFPRGEKRDVANFWKTHPKSGFFNIFFL